MFTCMYCHVFKYMCFSSTWFLLPPPNSEALGQAKLLLKMPHSHARCSWGVLHLKGLMQWTQTTTVWWQSHGSFYDRSCYVYTKCCVLFIHMVELYDIIVFPQIAAVSPLYNLSVVSVCVYLLSLSLFCCQIKLFWWLKHYISHLVLYYT